MRDSKSHPNRLYEHTLEVNTSDAQSPSSDAHHPLRRGFYASLTALESQHPEFPRLGEALRPLQEPVRLGQWPFMDFAVRELARLDRQDDGPRMYFQNFGLLGPQGALPLHLTEYALNRIQHFKDPTFTEFLNVFHHRMYLLFYRAWANAQPHIGWRSEDLNPYSRSAADLSGHGAEAFGLQMALLDSRRIGGAAHLTRSSRSREGLERWLSGVLGLEVRAFDHVGQWLNLSQEDTWRLGESPQQLGQSIVLGRRCLDVHFTVRIDYGPMTLKRYVELLPGQRQRRILDEAVACYLGLEYEWQHCLLLQAQEIPSCRLSKQGVALGRTAWLGQWDKKHRLRRNRQTEDHAQSAASATHKVLPPARVTWMGCQPQVIQRQDHPQDIHRQVGESK